MTICHKIKHKKPHGDISIFRDLMGNPKSVQSRPGLRYMYYKPKKGQNYDFCWPF